MMSTYLSAQIEGEPFRLFSLSHLSVLLLLLCCIGLLFKFRVTLRRQKASRMVRLGLAGVLFMSEAAFQLWYVLTNNWSAAEVLPLQLCSVSLLAAILMLLARSYRIYEITYFWGVGGAGQAMLTPELFYPFPHFRFFHFFVAHMAIILACLHMTWVEQYKPSVRSLWKAFGMLNVLLVIALIVNHITGGNYLFVSYKPSNPSLLDYLGPFPWYIVSLEAVALLLFYVLYLPFSKRKAASLSVEQT